MSKENRNTFLSCAQLLNEQVQRSNRVCLELQRTLAHSPEPQQPILKQILEKELKLSTCIKNFSEQGPAHLLNTQLQSTPDETIDNSNNGKHEDHTRIVAQLLALNDTISSQIETAKGSLPDTSNDAFEAFDSKVNSICRDISMAVVTMQDV